MNYYKRKKREMREIYSNRTKKGYSFESVEKEIIKKYGKDYNKGHTLHNSISEIPSDYKTPDKFSDDFGLLLRKEGIKEHSICFPINVRSDFGSMMSFPFSVSENPEDYINTTFMDRTRDMVRGNMMTSHFNYTIGNQTNWLSERIEKKQNVVNPDEMTQRICYTLRFNELNLMSEFVSKYRSDEVFYCKVRVGDEIVRNTIGDITEYYNEMNFIEFEDRSKKHDEFYNQKYNRNVG